MSGLVLLRATVTAVATIAIRTDHERAVAVYTPSRLRLQTAALLSKTFAARALRRLKVREMFRFGRGVVALRALLQQAHQFIIEIAHQQSGHSD